MTYSSKKDPWARQIQLLKLQKLTLKCWIWKHSLTYRKFLHFWQILSQGTTCFWSPSPVDDEMAHEILCRKTKKTSHGYFFIVLSWLRRETLCLAHTVITIFHFVRSSCLNNFKGSTGMLRTRTSFNYFMKPMRGGGGEDSQPQVTNIKW